MIAQADRIKDEQKDAYARKEREVRKELGAEKKTTATLADKLERTDKRIERIEMKLTLFNGRLREWEGHVSMLRDIDIDVL
jgi:septal ring factor EnvC (AmiA/AmiB activator)